MDAPRNLELILTELVPKAEGKKKTTTHEPEETTYWASGSHRRGHGGTRAWLDLNQPWSKASSCCFSSYGGAAEVDRASGQDAVLMFAEPFCAGTARTGS